MMTLANPARNANITLAPNVKLCYDLGRRNSLEGALASAWLLWMIYGA